MARLSTTAGGIERYASGIILDEEDDRKLKFDYTLTDTTAGSLGDKGAVIQLGLKEGVALPVTSPAIATENDLLDMISDTGDWEAVGAKSQVRDIKQYIAGETIEHGELIYWDIPSVGWLGDGESGERWLLMLSPDETAPYTLPDDTDLTAFKAILDDGAAGVNMSAPLRVGKFSKYYEYTDGTTPPIFSDVLTEPDAPVFYGITTTGTTTLTIGGNFQLHIAHNTDSSQVPVTVINASVATVPLSNGVWMASYTRSHGVGFGGNFRIRKISDEVAPVSTTIIDDLVTGGTTDALSAEQGKTLKDLLDAHAADRTTLHLPDPTTGTAGQFAKINAGATAYELGDLPAVTPNNVFAGPGAPTPAEGLDGEYKQQIDAVGNDLWGPKAAGAWPAQADWNTQDIDVSAIANFDPTDADYATAFRHSPERLDEWLALRRRLEHFETVAAATGQSFIPKDAFTIAETNQFVYRKGTLNSASFTGSADANFEILGGSDSKPIRFYAADGAVSDEDQWAIFGPAVTAMTLPATVADRCIQFSRQGVADVTLTANGVDEFTGGDPSVTTTDQTLVINLSNEIGTLLGITGGWNVFEGATGSTGGGTIAILESTATKYKDTAGRLVQSGVTNAGAVTFAEPFKAGTVPIVFAVVEATGDNQNVTIQSRTNTGFGYWSVRNESDVGTAANVLWTATGEAE